MGAFSSFKQALNAKAAVKDFAQVWKSPTPHRWGFLGLSVALTFTLMMLFLPESQRGEEPRPDITYISSWPEGRTDEEIVASNIENQRRKEERQALAEERAQISRDAYKALGRATGVDVDEIEREAEAEREAAEARTRAEVEQRRAARAAAQGE